MMKVLLVLAGIVATSLAWSNTGGGQQQGGSGNNFWQWMMMQNHNNQGQGSNYGNGNGMSNQWGQGMGNQYGNNQWGNGQMSNGHGGGQQQMPWMQSGGGGHNNQMGMQNNHGILGLLLMNLVGSAMKGNKDQSRGDYIEKDDMEDFEAFMKYKMISELTEEITKNMNLKKSEKEFHRAVKSLCWIHYVIDSSMNETERETVTAEEKDSWSDKVDDMTDEEGVRAIAKMKSEQSEDRFGAIVLSVMEWVCDSGEKLEDALEMKKSSYMGDKDGSSSSSDSSDSDDGSRGGWN